MGGITEVGTPFAYETNITEFPTFISQRSHIENNGNFNIYFRKVPGRPLLLFLDYEEEKEYCANVTDAKGGVMDDLHYKYIFIIEPSSFEDCYSMRGIGTNILLTYI